MYKSTISLELIVTYDNDSFEVRNCLIWQGLNRCLSPRRCRFESLLPARTIDGQSAKALMQTMTLDILAVEGLVCIDVKNVSLMNLMKEEPSSDCSSCAWAHQPTKSLFQCSLLPLPMAYVTSQTHAIMFLGAVELKAKVMSGYHRKKE